MRDYLITRIDSLDRQIEALDEKAADIVRDRMIAVAQRSAYQDALEHLPVEAGSAPTKKRGRSGLRSGAWREVFGFIASRWPGTVTNDQMMAFIIDSELSLTRQALRAQLSTYTQKGGLERAGDGVYRITRQGQEELGLVPVPEVEAAADSQSAAAFELSSAERA